MRESIFQKRLIKEIHRRLPGCIVLKNDPTYIQGIPDLLILWGDRWAALECKLHENSIRSVNQVHYISVMNRMSFAAFISPQNKETVLNALQHAFGTSRTARFSGTE